MRKSLLAVGLAVAAIAMAASLTACKPLVKEGNIIIPRKGEALNSSDVTSYEQWSVTPQELTMKDGAVIRGAAFERKDAKRTVIYFGGNGFVLSKMYKHALAPWRELPVNVYVFDHRGYGGSAGSGGFVELYQDGVEIFDAVRSRSELPVVVHGHSLGSFIAGQVAQKRKLGGLVLESSATTTEEWGRGSRWYVPQWVVSAVVDPKLRRQGNAAVVRNLDEPTLFVVGANDTTTWPAMNRKLFDASLLPAADKKFVVVPGRGHTDAGLGPEFSEGLRWLLTR